MSKILRVVTSGVRFLHRTSFFQSVAVSIVCLRTHGVAAGILFCNLVDPASSHMLASKIKPCMSKYKLLYGETANGSLKQLSSP